MRAVIAEARASISVCWLRRPYGLVAPEVRATLKAAASVLDPMDTGAACRTFNVLVAEAAR